MILRQFLHADPVAISYLLGCGGQQAGAVVDPVGDLEPYLAAANETGMRILHVIDTHLHADHLSAGRRLARRRPGRPMCCSRRLTRRAPSTGCATATG